MEFSHGNRTFWQKGLNLQYDSYKYDHYTDTMYAVRNFDEKLLLVFSACAKTWDKSGFHILRRQEKGRGPQNTLLNLHFTIYILQSLLQGKSKQALVKKY